MLGKECLRCFPISENPWNTDDEIVLAIGKHFPVVHSGAYVSIYHMHDSPTKMSNDARKVFQGVNQLAKDHQADVLRNHGIFYVLLWRLRVLKALVRYQIAVADSRINLSATPGSGVIRRQYWRGYRKCLLYCQAALAGLLHRYFILDYF
jgi:hypothetical protein